ncbi:hypothetical protein [Niallia sp. NCCP-28]|uniref:hypothetical protein n=1 Tax=Niallia sp. NCCP-28 TaxID=2934712 RepID=UPI0020C0350A|nr:hypothetical protein [Niallia sp. NCCP-28]
MVYVISLGINKCSYGFPVSHDRYKLNQLMIKFKKKLMGMFYGAAKGSEMIIHGAEHEAVP